MTNWGIFANILLDGIGNTYVWDTTTGSGPPRDLFWSIININFNLLHCTLATDWLDDIKIGVLILGLIDKQF